MHTRWRFGVAVLALAALALLLIDGERAGAAPITWGSATTITGDTDVDTTGTLVAALHLGDTGVANTTVNGVTFAGLAISGTSVTSGNFTFDIVPTLLFGQPQTFPFVAFNGATSAKPPFANLSQSYQNLLSSGAGGKTFGVIPPFVQTFSLTMKGLTVGHTYEFEWWSDHSTNVDTGVSTTATAGNSVTLVDNNLIPQTNGDGGVGQFAIGTFTADATSEVVTFTGFSETDTSVLNALQLRDLSPAAPPPAVPEPSSLALLAVGGLALAGWRRWRRKHDHK